MVPGPRTSTRSPGRSAAAATGAQGVAAGLDHRTQRRVHGVGQRVQRGDRDGQLLGQRAGPAATDADLVPVLADVLRAPTAAAAVPAAEHGVADHPAADPSRVDPGADRGDRPHHSWPSRIGIAGVALRADRPSRR